MFAIKLSTACLRGLGWFVGIGCMWFAAGSLLQGVAQLDVEGLAKQPETVEQAWHRVQMAAVLFAVGLCGELVRQVGKLFSEGLRPVSRTRLRKTTFEMVAFWCGACLFVCLIIVAGSFQARWPVPGPYYWAAGGAGALTAIFLGALELLHQEAKT